jgi:hypothetical protein
MSEQNEYPFDVTAPGPSQRLGSTAPSPEPEPVSSSTGTEGADDRKITTLREEENSAPPSDCRTASQLSEGAKD